MFDKTIKPIVVDSASVSCGDYRCISHDWYFLPNYNILPQRQKEEEK